jgi:hypothetical protein
MSDAQTTETTPATDPAQAQTPDTAPGAESDRAAERAESRADDFDDQPKTAFVRRPVPGDVSYAPPARVAQVAGKVLSAEHYDYTLGHSGMSVTGQVPLAMPAPAYEPVTTPTSSTPPSQLSAPIAISLLHKMVGELRAWIGDFPHQVSGESAVVVQFFRDLSARRASLNTAAALGRTMEPDAVDQTEHLPPPEFFALRHMAASFRHALAIYDRALSDAGAPLSRDDQASIDRIKAEFAPLADGPESPDQVPTDDAPAAA